MIKLRNVLNNVLNNNEGLQNVFVNEDGIINFCGQGQLAPIDILEDLASIGQQVEGCLQLEDGVYNWVSKEINQSILAEDPRITKEELLEVQGCYCRINKNIPLIYTSFMTDIELEEGAEEVVAMNFNDKALSAITTGYGDNLYSYNYYVKGYNIIKTVNIITKEMLKNCYEILVN